jgi:hypothetical protein
MNTRHYLVTGGTVVETLCEFCTNTAAAQEARLKLCDEVSGESVMSCEGPLFGILFPESYTPDPKQWRWDRGLEAWVPRKGTKEGRALHARLYTNDTRRPTGVDLARKLKLNLFPEKLVMHTPGFRDLGDGRWLLDTKDDKWVPPAGCNRISDIEYETLVEADERRRTE